MTAANPEVIAPAGAQRQSTASSNAQDALPAALWRGRAITFIFLGWSVASVLGMPIAAYVGGTLGWRAAFGVVAVLSLASAAWVWLAMPDGVKPAALSRAAWSETFRSRALMTCVLV